jgi:leader peptidase (prepilin peptidase) / N-methyltransferase
MYGVWTPVFIALTAALGAVAGYTVRAAVFHHSVTPGEDWRTECPNCHTLLVRPGWRLATSGLRPAGRCRLCRARVGPPPASVELIAAAVFGVLAWRLGAHVSTLAFLWAAIVGVALAFVDGAVHRLPDRLIATAVAGTLVGFGLATAFGTPYTRLLIACACGLGAGLAYFIMVFATPSGMGLGDAKLAILVGLTTGWFGVTAALYGLFLGLLIAGLTALTLLALRRVTRKDRIAHGPSMLLGALAAIIMTRF